MEAAESCFGLLISLCWFLALSEEYALCYSKVYDSDDDNEGP